MAKRAIYDPVCSRGSQILKAATVDRKAASLRSRASILVLGSALFIATSAAQAADATSVVSKSLVGPQAGGAEYWTPERLRNARPLSLPKSAMIPAPTDDLAAAGAAPSVSGAGKPPTVRIKPDLNNKLFEPDPAAEEAEIAPRNVGTLGAHFSSSRVFPDAATTTYPYRAVGKLFFTQPGVGDFICSASVLRPRVVLTAGHCVHRGSGGQGGFFTNFRFVPAFRSGVAPFGTWTAAAVFVTTTWFNGGGFVPNAADYAMFDMNDLGGRKIGTVTGVLGFVTNRLRPNHAHLIGYPANHDDGLRMHQVTAESFAADINNSVIYGSDMRGGSSGGPWVQNFGVPATGQTGGLNTVLNAVVGITSYGPVEIGPLYQGSSVPDARFTTLLNQVCARRAGNC